MSVYHKNRWGTGPSTMSVLIAMVGFVAGSMSLFAPAAAAKEIRKGNQRGASSAKKIITIEGITEYQLDNGLQVLLFPDPSKSTVTVNVTYRVGSRHEGRGEAGMAHLLEHMVFKGTPSFENIWGALEDHGASFNGSTWLDRTNYFETLTASDENLDFALHMESDRMVNSNISAKDLAKEMTVVRNEFEMGENNPTSVLSERMLSSAYLWHNYGKSTIGNKSDIERVPATSLKKFYKKYYQPDNATLVVAGKFEPGRTLKLIQRYFGSIPRPTRVLENTYTEEPVQDGARFVELKRVGDVSAAGLVYHIPAGSHPDFPAVQVLESVLTDEPAGRLYKALVEKGLATSVSGFAFPLQEPGVVQFMAQVPLNQDVRKVLDKMEKVVEGVATANITDQEVQRIKTRLLKNIKLALTDSGRIGVRLSEWIALGDWRMFFIHRDEVKKVKTEDVQRVGRDYLQESNRTAGLFFPTKEPTRAIIPPKPDVSQIVKGYRGTETIDQGEKFAATIDNIEKRTQRFTLRDGFKVAFLPKQTRGDAVRASFNIHVGTEGGLRGHNAELELIPELMMRGTTQRDYQQLRDEIDRLQSRINVFGGVGIINASIESDRANIVSAIKLLGEILKKPAFAEDQFAIVTKEKLTQLEKGLSNPQARGFNAMFRAMNPWPKSSIHYVPTLEEQIGLLKGVSLGTVRDLYSRFFGGSRMEVAVVGDFDEKGVRSALNETFGNWKSPSAYKRIAKPFRPVTPIRKTILTPDKKMAVVGTATSLEMRDDNPDYPALSFGTYILGQSAKSRLLNRLRHKGGLSYGAGARFNADNQDRRASILGYAICAPQNALKAQKAMREEFNKWIADGITDQELTEGKKSYALRFKNNLASDRFLVNDLVSDLEIDRTLRYDETRLAKVQALTLADIQKVLKKYLSNAPFAEMKAGDLEKVKE